MINGNEKRTECLNCGRAINWSHPCFSTRRGDICMQCEGAEIDVYEIQYFGEGNKLVDCDLEAAVDTVHDFLLDADEGDSYLITKSKMKALHYFDMEEFDGF